MMKDNHLLRDTTITDESDDTRTQKIKIDRLNETVLGKSCLCMAFEFSNIESIDFDFLEMHVIEED